MSSDDERLRDFIAADLADIATTHMPFGKYGPEHFPPRGMPLYDLPVEYLAWFARKGGFPQGRLGELLRIVHQMKVDGLDEVFDELRRRAGGRRPLRTPNRQGNRHFE
ncbi:MAG: DUF3820 family protein [Chthoniobacter sp.]|nr:DUF3820 family protein [Chthoniobacter sp.]